MEIGEELTRSRSGATWASDLEPWERLTEHGLHLFGHRWAFCVLANTGAGIRSNEMRCKDADELFDESIGLFGALDMEG